MAAMFKWNGEASS